jgi:hypothetical protein
VDIFTTSGKTDFTTGAKPALLGPSFGSANFSEACTLPENLENNVWLARATPNPAAPTRKIIANAVVFGFPQNCDGFMFSPSRTFPCSFPNPWLYHASSWFLI